MKPRQLTDAQIIAIDHCAGIFNGWAVLFCIEHGGFIGALMCFLAMCFFAWDIKLRKPHAKRPKR
ncbi:MAG: hypothetical protein ACN2B6_12640 [Rickettsiales bacterium]